MVIGALLLFSPFIGIVFAMNHSSAFLNVSLMSDPAATSSANNLMLFTTITGMVGLLVLACSVVSFIRGGHSHQSH